MGDFEAIKLGPKILQSGIPKRRGIEGSPLSAGGLLLRGVVVATYVVDDDVNPVFDLATPTAVYCDVLTYGNRAGLKIRLVRQVLVLQPTGGMHRGHIWKPQAATKDITGHQLQEDKIYEPANLDGDHVLVGFMHDSLSEPVILGGLPHPSADKGNDGRVNGQRLKLKKVDGAPDYWKHHGIHYGVSEDSYYIVDSRFANDGSTDAEGHEPGWKDEAGQIPVPLPNDGTGSQLHKLPLDGVHRVSLYDMTDPESPQEKVRLDLQKARLDLEFNESSLRVVVDDTSGMINLGREDNGSIDVDGNPNTDRVPLDSSVQVELDRIRQEFNDRMDEWAKTRHPQEMFYMPLIPNPAKPIVECVKAPLVYTVPGQKPINLITSGEAKIANAPMDHDASIGEYVGPKPSELATVLRLSGLYTKADNPGETMSQRVTLDK